MALGATGFHRHRFSGVFYLKIPSLPNSFRFMALARYSNQSRRADEYVALKFQPANSAAQRVLERMDALPSCGLLRTSPWPASRETAPRARRPPHRFRGCGRNFCIPIPAIRFRTKRIRDIIGSRSPVVLDRGKRAAASLALRIWFAPSRTAAICFLETDGTLLAAHA